MPIILDELPANRDRAKESWDLPPYLSKPFLDWLRKASISLSEFKKLTIYLHAVEEGLIKDDAWVIQRL